MSFQTLVIPNINLASASWVKRRSKLGVPEVGTLKASTNKLELQLIEFGMAGFL